MLQQLRDQTQGTGFKILVGAIIVVLTLFGFGATNLFMAGDPEVARVGDFSITQSVLAQETQRERVRILGQMGPDFDASSIDLLQLQQYVVQQLVNRQIAYQTTAELGVRTSPELVNETLVQSEAYWLDGQFNESLYRQYVSNLGYTPVGFIEEFTNAVSSEIVRTGVTETQALADWELAEIVRIFGQSRDLAYLPLTIEGFSQDVEISEEDIQVRYEEQQNNFLTDLTVDVAYVHLRVEDLLDSPGIEISEDDLLSLYEDERAQALRDEQRASSHILVQVNGDRDDAEALQLVTGLAERLDAGEDFSILAGEFSEDPGSAQNGGSLGAVGKGIFDPAFESALWSLANAGDVSEPVLSAFGYHLIRLDEIVEQDYPSLDEERDALSLRARRAKAQEIFSDRALELERSAYDEQFTLDATAAGLELELQHASRVPENGGEVAGVLANPAVRAALFSDTVLDGLNSDAIVLGEEELVVVRVTEQHAPELKPLASVSEEITTAITRERALNKIETAKSAGLARLMAGESVSEIAGDLGVAWQSHEAVGRTPRSAAEASIPQGIRGYAFTLPRPPAGEKSVGAVDTDNGAALVTVTRVVPGDINATSQAEVSEIRRVAAERAARLSYQSLLQSAEVTIGVDRPAG